MSGKWLKLSADFCDDEKIKIIRGHEGGDTFIWIWLWLLTTAMKKETDTLYVVAGIPYDAALIAQQADVKIDAVVKSIELFSKLKMIDWLTDGGLVLINFHKHQAIAELHHKRYLATDRKRKQRERDISRIEYVEENVTRDTCDSHATEKRRVEKSREEKNTTSVPPTGGLDDILPHWYKLNTDSGLSYYKTTKADKADLSAMLSAMPAEQVQLLMDKWFLARKQERDGSKYYPARITSFCSGYQRVTGIKGKDDWAEFKGWPI